MCHDILKGHLKGNRMYKRWLLELINNYVIVFFSLTIILLKKENGSFFCTTWYLLDMNLTSDISTSCSSPPQGGPLHIQWPPRGGLEQLVETLGVKFILNSYQVVQKKNRFLSSHAGDWEMSLHSYFIEPKRDRTNIAYTSGSITFTLFVVVLLHHIIKCQGLFSNLNFGRA